MMGEKTTKAPRKTATKSPPKAPPGVDLAAEVNALRNELANIGNELRSIVELMKLSAKEKGLVAD